MKIFELILLKMEMFSALGFAGYTTYSLSKEPHKGIFAVVALAVISSLVSLYFSGQSSKLTKFLSGIVGVICSVVLGVFALFLYSPISLWLTSLSAFFITVLLYSCKELTIKDA